MEGRISFILILSMAFTSPLLSFADDIIQGHYCYTYGDNESLREARDVTRSLATRNAIESYQVFISSASNVQNSQLTNDLVQIISSGYLKDIKVIEHEEQGRTICETIQARIVSPEGINYSVEVNRGNWIRIKEEKIGDQGITFWDYDESSIKFISRDSLTARMRSTIKAGSIILLLKVTEFRLYCNCEDLPDCKGRLATTISETEFDNLNLPVWRNVHYKDWLELKPVPKSSVLGIFADKFCPQ